MIFWPTWNGNIGTQERGRVGPHLSTFLLRSNSGDVATVFGPLTRMAPARLHFNPQSFQYGGLLLYPIAGLIKAASVAGILELSPRLTYYVRHPEDFLRMALIGRFYIALMNILCVVDLEGGDHSERTLGGALGGAILRVDPGGHPRVA